MQDHQGKAHCGAALAVQLFRTIEFVLHVASDGVAFREKRCAVEFEELLLHKPAHDIRDIDGLGACASNAAKAVLISTRERKS